MKATFFAMAAVLAATTASAPAKAATPGQDTAAANMEVFGEARAPIGYTQFCGQFPQECAVRGRGRTNMSLTESRWRELDAINRSVNRAIKPLTDMEIYGVTEYWTLPATAGDCEDYALMKRKLLMERGWPASSLLMTVVRDERGEGHAVLTARTAQGDFVLDNKVDGVKIWFKTPYQFVMRQSYLNPKVWVGLEAGDTSRPASLAGVSSRR